MEYVKILPVKISPAFVESFEWIYSLEFFNMKSLQQQIRIIIML